jgi:hypothetical protein
MAWVAMHSWTTGQTISGTTASTNASLSLNYQLTGNLLSARNLWDNAIHFSLSANQSIPDAANTSVIWNVADWQVGNSTIWTSASNPARARVTVAGRWEALGTLEWALNTSGRRGVRLQVTGTTLMYRCGVQTPEINSGDGANQPFGDILELTTADYVEVLAFQNSGAALNLKGGNVDRTRFSWRFLGAAS